MKGCVTYRLVDDQVAIANLDVVEAVWVGADPGFELDRSALTAKVGKWHQIAGAALSTSWKDEFHAPIPLPQAPGPPADVACATEERELERIPARPLSRAVPVLPVLLYHMYKSRQYILAPRHLLPVLQV